jgi:hypothetical protein
MTEHALLDVLSAWHGRRTVQTAFEARGFLVHKSWQTRVIALCGEEKRDLLNRYWDEVAMETIACVGQGDPQARIFAVQPKYRSPFLDELAAKADFAEPPFRSFPLIKCLFEYRKRLIYDREFLFDETAFFENLKSLEAARLGIRTEGWSGKKRDAIPFVTTFANPLGFERYRNKYRKKITNDLVFDIGVDTGGRPHVGGLPLIFSIFHFSDPDFSFEIGVFERIVPGFDRYAHCSRPSDYVLGIRAHVELFNVIANSFVN